MNNEKETTGASYIINFYREVQILTHNYANYTNLLLEVENKYGKEAKNIEPEVTNIITQQTQEVRLGITKTYIQYKSILLGAKINDENFKELEKAYLEMKTNFVIKRETLEKYIINLNAALVKEVIQTLLTSGENLFKEIYPTQ